MYQRILVPVDGSETSGQALATAIGLARTSSGRLRLLHVVDEMAYLNGYDQFGGYSGELIRYMREAGARLLKDGVAQAREQGVDADELLYANFGTRLGEAVAQAATDWPADLVVVGTHGRKGLGRVLLGSGAEQVIRLAPVPVLVIRAPSPAA